MRIAYLDNSSTTVCCDKAINAAVEAMKINYGNPSSLHSLGINAEEYLRNCRRNVSSVLNVSEDEIFFTSGGTEANNIAVLGVAGALKKRGNRIVTSAIEHPSVLNCMKKLENDGFEVVYLKPNNYGVITNEQVIQAINKDTILVSLMLVNNEVGTFLPISQVKRTIENVGSPALFHCDAVQGFGKIKINPQKYGIDLLSFSGHKIHGPKGVGVLYKKRSARISPINFGGGQELAIRNGTQSTPLIAALDGAIEEVKQTIDINYNHVGELKKELVSRLSEFSNIKINSPEDSLPYILNFSVVGYKSETILHFLDQVGVYVSAGSACSKGNRSHVLTAMGLDNSLIDSSIRVSFSRYNSKEDIDQLVGGIYTACNSLKHM